MNMNSWFASDFVIEIADLTPISVVTQEARTVVQPPPDGSP